MASAETIAIRFNWNIGYVVARCIMLIGLILMLMPSTTTPRRRDFPMLYLDMKNSSTAHFGNYGWCMLRPASGQDYCIYDKNYHPASIIAEIEGSDFNSRIVAELFRWNWNGDLFTVIFGIATVGWTVSWYPNRWCTMFSFLCWALVLMMSFWTNGWMWFYAADEVNGSTTDFTATIGAAYHCWWTGEWTYLLTQIPLFTAVVEKQAQVSYEDFNCFSRGYRAAPQDEETTTSPTTGNDIELTSNNRQSTTSEEDIEGLPAYSVNDPVKQIPTNSSSV